MYAVVKTGSKQYKVSQGDVIEIEKIDTPIGEKVILDKVLLVGTGSNITTGGPYIDGFKVTGKVTEQLKAKKIIVFKKRRRKNYRRKNGHRQLLTRVKIMEIPKE